MRNNKTEPCDGHFLPPTFFSRISAIKNIKMTVCLWLLSLAFVSLVPTASHGQGSNQSPAATNGVATMRAGDKQFGMTFLVPKGIELYSITHPGPLSSQISAQEPFILVRPEFHDENINIKVADGVTESDLKGMKDQLDSNPNMPLPGYKRIGVRNTSVGKNGAIKAVEHDFQMQGNVLGRMRSVTFVIDTRGFIISCGTSVDRFDNAIDRPLQRSHVREDVEIKVIVLLPPGTIRFNGATSARTWK